MCYHVSVNKTQKELEKRFGAKFSKPNLFQPIYYANGFAAPHLAAITNDDPYVIQLLTWGLIPHWIKNEDKALEIRFKTLNSRADTIFSKASFRQPIRNQRCLILVDGFFDWRLYKGKKYPYYVKLKNNEAFALAGIWDVWENKENQKKIKTFSIITTEANEYIAKIHNIKKRMPVIFGKKEERTWLENINDEKIKEMLNPYEAKEMTAYPVSKLITARGMERNVPEILKPFEYKELEKIK